MKLSYELKKKEDDGEIVTIAKITITKKTVIFKVTEGYEFTGVMQGTFPLIRKIEKEPKEQTRLSTES